MFTCRVRKSKSCLIVNHLLFLNDLWWGWSWRDSVTMQYASSCSRKIVCAKPFLSLTHTEKGWKYWISIMDTFLLSLKPPLSSSQSTPVQNCVPIFTVCLAYISPLNFHSNFFAGYFFIPNIETYSLRLRQVR